MSVIITMIFFSTWWWRRKWPISPSLITEHIAVTLKMEAAIAPSPQYQHMLLHVVKTRKSIIWATPAVEVWIPVIYYTVLQCCKTTMLNKIVSSDRDLVGVILFGTNNTLNVQHVVVLQDLEELNAEKIKQLLTMLKRKLVMCLFQSQQIEN